MKSEEEQLTEAARRRKRVNLYKRIIVIFIAAMIVLPTILCIILFFKLNSLSKEVKGLKSDLSQYVSMADSKEEQEVVNNNTKPSETDKPTDVSETRNQDSNASQKPEETQTTGNNTASQTEIIQNETEPAAEQAASEQTVSEQEAVQAAVKAGRKVVYLTFDDGPGKNTAALLDVLKKYDVKVTFFVNGYTGFEDELNRIIEEGHTLAMHTYSHRYEVVYGSLDSFINEVVTLQDYLTDVTGIKPVLFRFPGGSSNEQTNIPISTFTEYLDEVGITYFDWNVSSGDGSNNITTESVYNNVMNGVAQNDVSIVLMHDSPDKSATFNAVPKIIESLQEMDALILPITSDTEPVHHNVK